MRKKIALLLVVAMLLSVLPITAAAEEGDATARKVTFTTGDNVGISSVSDVSYKLNDDASLSAVVTDGDWAYTIRADATSVSFKLEYEVENDATVKVTAKIGKSEAATECTAADGAYTCDLSGTSGDIEVTVAIETKERETLTKDAFTIDTNGLTQVYTGGDLASVFKGAFTEPSGGGTIEYAFKKGTEAATTVVDVGTYSVFASITGSSVFADATDVELADVTVTAKSIEGASVALKKGGDAVTDEGLAWVNGGQTVTVDSVTLESKTLTVGTEYTVSGNLTGSAIDEYTVTVTGTGNYTGTVETKWKIVQVDLTTAATIESIPDQKYTGSEIKPAVIVKVNDAVVSQDNYTVTFSGNTDVGTASVTVTAKENTNYKGTQTGTFTIVGGANPATVQAAHILKANDTGYDLNGLVTMNDYTGTPTFSATSSLSHGSLNGSTYTPSSEGSDDITVTFPAAGNYAAKTAKITIEVVSADTTLVVPEITVSGFVYTGRTRANVTYDISEDVVVTVTFTGTKPDGVTPHDTITTTGDKLAEEAPRDAGDWTVTVSATVATTRYSGSKQFTISPADLANAETRAADWVYDGTQHTFEPEVLIDNTTLVKNVDYTVSGNTATNIGSYSMTVTAAASNQNYTGSITVTYKVVGKALTITGATANDKVYDGDGTIEITGVTFKEADSETVVVLAKDSDYTAEGTAADNGAAGTGRQVSVTVSMLNENYTLSEDTMENACTVNISPADLSDASPSEIPDQTYTGSAIMVDDFTVTLNGKDLTKGTDYDIDYESADNNKCIAIGRVDVTITGKGNYTGTLRTSYNIIGNGLTQRAITVSPTSVTVTAGSSATVTITDNAKDDSATYGLNGNDDKIATVAVDGDTITVYGKAAGDTTVTLNAPATNAYAALTPPVTIAIKVNAAETPETPPAVEADPVVVVDPSLGLTTEEEEQVTASAESVGVAGLAELPNETEVKKLISDVVTADKKAEAYETLKDKVPNVGSAEDIAPVIVTYMNIQVTGYKPDKGTLSMDIKPMMMVVLTSSALAASGDELKMEGNGQNAVEVRGSERDVTVSEPVTVTIALPPAFVEYVNGRPLYVRHNKKYEYKVKETQGKFSFTTAHGFSPFEFTVDSESGAWIGDVGYKNLSAALDEVQDGQTIEVTNSDTSGSTARTDLKGKSFTIRKSGSAWSGSVTINGTVYKPDSNGKITVTGTSGPGTSGGGGGSSSKPSIVNPGQTPNAPATPNSGVAGFSDVSANAWYADAVRYVVSKGLFDGVGNGAFAPNANMTRAMMWTVLARYMGVDVKTANGKWYEAARTWAISKGISDGTMAEGNVTREQFVTMLWRLSGEPAVANSASFTDGGRVSAYAKTAVDWAVAQGIVNGYNDGSFRPQGSATRAEVAKMLTVFCTNAENAPAETAPAETTPEETTPEETAPQTTVPDDEK